MQITTSIPQEGFSFITDKFQEKFEKDVLRDYESNSKAHGVVHLSWYPGLYCMDAFVWDVMNDYWHYIEPIVEEDYEFHNEDGKALTSEEKEEAVFEIIQDNFYEYESSIMEDIVFILNKHQLFYIMMDDIEVDDICGNVETFIPEYYNQPIKGVW